MIKLSSAAQTQRIPPKRFNPHSSRAWGTPNASTSKRHAKNVQLGCSSTSSVAQLELCRVLHTQLNGLTFQLDRYTECSM